mmetsp:Transcript_42252/g.99215  ORF Transcript_42252/g.99215 Transcript_42252/m.99215 type:complete len:677 (+) Transcript_42252:52-2082(+)
MGCVGKLCRCLRAVPRPTQERKQKVQEVNDDAAEDDADSGDGHHITGPLFQCATCLDLLESNPLELAEEWIRYGAAEKQQANVQHTDTGLYIAAVRASQAVAASVAEGIECGAVGSPSRSALHSAYRNLTSWLEETWASSLDPHRARPFQRLQCAWLLQLKLILELCYPDAFHETPHQAELSALAIAILTAIQASDVDVLWDSVDRLGRRRRRILQGKRRSWLSEVVSVMLLIKAYAGLLSDRRRPVEARGGSSSEALNTMRREAAELAAKAPTKLAWLAVWQLLTSADRMFRDAHGGSTDVLLLRRWAVGVAGELTKWRAGDPHSAAIAVAAVQHLVSWRTFIKQQGQHRAKDEAGISQVAESNLTLVIAIDEALASASEYCCSVAKEGGGLSAAAGESRSVLMFLNDHHLACAAELALSQSACSLHGQPRGGSGLASQKVPCSAVTAFTLESAGRLAMPLQLADGTKRQPDSGGDKAEVPELSGFDLISQLEGSLPRSTHAHYQHVDFNHEEVLDGSGIELLDKLALDLTAELVTDGDSDDDDFDMEAQEVREGPSLHPLGSQLVPVLHAQEPLPNTEVTTNETFVVAGSSTRQAPLPDLEATVAETKLAEGSSPRPDCTSRPGALDSMEEAAPQQESKPAARRKPGQVSSLVNFYETKGGLAPGATGGAAQWL